MEQFSNVDLGRCELLFETISGLIFTVVLKPIWRVLADFYCRDLKFQILKTIDF
jgi:hypothetical protein